jgi:PIN domain nuclease of toxin-antitoxin system
MQVKYLLDTHIWIWWNMNPQKLSSRIIKLIQDKDYDELILSAISPWEFCKLIEKKKLAVSCSQLEWLDVALEMEGLRLAPVTPLISYKSTTLKEPFNNDPADQIIVATAQIENAVILSADKIIQDYPHIKTIW